MKTALVGYTGFVGSNLMKAYPFDSFYNSQNIQQSYGTKPELLIYAGIRAEKFIANQEPEKDRRIIEEAFINIKKIQPEKLVLISTVDIYQSPVEVDEESEIQTENLNPYGKNRFLLEQMVRGEYPSASVIRLPGLFGINMKKNFIYDYLNPIPSMLRLEKYRELCERKPNLSNYYRTDKSGFYKCKKLNGEGRDQLERMFSALGFSALNFTDSRSVFQFYPLKRLWSDIEVVIKNDLKIWNPATEPVSSAELYRHLCGKEFVNELKGIPASYNYYTKYAELFGGDGNYILKKEQVLDEIKEFVERVSPDEISSL